MSAESVARLAEKIARELSGADIASRSVPIFDLMTLNNSGLPDRKTMVVYGWTAKTGRVFLYHQGRTTIELLRKFGHHLATEEEMKSIKSAARELENNGKK